PDASHPGDVTRLTASAGHTHNGAISTVVFAAWRQNREAVGALNAVTLESQVSWLEVNYLYSRAELVTKDIVHIIGDHHGGVVDGHPLSQIGAFTLGYTRDLNRGMRGRLGIGGDMTLYYVSENLKER